MWKIKSGKLRHICRFATDQEMVRGKQNNSLKSGKSQGILFRVRKKCHFKEMSARIKIIWNNWYNTIEGWKIARISSFSLKWTSRKDGWKFMLESRARSGYYTVCVYLTFCIYLIRKKLENFEKLPCTSVATVSLGQRLQIENFVAGIHCTPSKNFATIYVKKIHVWVRC